MLAGEPVSAVRQTPPRCPMNPYRATVLPRKPGSCQSAPKDRSPHPLPFDWHPRWNTRAGADRERPSLGRAPLDTRLVVADSCLRSVGGRDRCEETGVRTQKAWPRALNQPVGIDGLARLAREQSCADGVDKVLSQAARADVRGWDTRRCDRNRSPDSAGPSGA